VSHHSKEVSVEYCASLREQRGVSRETVSTCAETPRELYDTLREQHDLELPIDSMRVAVNDAIKNWDMGLDDGDDVVFLPPVSGGSKCL
jgi:molybdopterin synthase sulfur carrier subunit